MTLVKIKEIRCSLDIPIGLEIALDCVFDSKYPYEHKEVIFSTPKQAFGEFRSGFEGVTQDCFIRIHTLRPVGRGIRLTGVGQSPVIERRYL